MASFLSRVGIRLRAAVGFALACLAVLIAIEGLSSLILVGRAYVDGAGPLLAERRHTQYDPDLGWVNTPGVHIPDLYGPGRSLSINAQGFRGLRDTPDQVAAGTFRIICSGDSFTLGYGVGDADTWCARLAAMDSRLETVNMGQGGYGVDQAYLWYARDGAALEHQIHLFAFVREDFARMGSERFLQYGKPILRAEQGRLVAHNVPVPRRGFYTPSLVANFKSFESLRSVVLLRPLLSPIAEPEIDLHELFNLSWRVFDELRRLNERKDSQLVLIYLPMRGDYLDTRDPWRLSMHREATRRGAVWIDLVEALQQRAESEVSDLYIPDGSLDHPFADGHFNAEGNAWIAEQLYDRLLEFLADR
jgi:hypothetical protein